MNQFSVLYGVIFFLALPFVLISSEREVNPTFQTAEIDAIRRFEKEYMEFISTGNETRTLQQLTQHLSQTIRSRQLLTKEVSDYSPFDFSFANSGCQVALNLITSIIRKPTGLLRLSSVRERLVKNVAIDICIRFELSSDEICQALINSNYQTVDYIVQNSDIDTTTLCSIYISDGYDAISDEYNWSLKIDQTDSLPLSSHKMAAPDHSSTNQLRILHLTDFHYDPLYVPGSLAECDEPLCCQRPNTVAEDTKRSAGYWGDYRSCDSPWQLVEEVLQHIKETHSQIDYVYQTGDIVDHMVWSTSITKNSETLTRVHERILQEFPDIPVYPCIGNHEPHPMNVFSPEDVPKAINTRWLYEHLYNDWKRWLPETTRETILKGGYYTVSPRSGFRVITLNSNDCYNKNWWIYYNGTSMVPQLQWLHDTLLAAESNGEFVHILSHVPSGDTSCWNVWAREYNRILARFSRIIGATFNGHSHSDEMNVHYTEEGHAFTVSWNGGSLTTYSNGNPNYRLYQVETSSMQVVDHETWIFNLTEANQHGSARRPNWFREYRFSEEFTNDLSPAGIDALLERMASDPQLLQKYWRYNSKSSDYFSDTNCEGSCLLNLICRIARTVNNQEHRCVELQSKLSQTLESRNAGPTFFVGSSLIVLSFSLNLFLNYLNNLI